MALVLENDEKILISCSRPELWAKESYGSMALRYTPALKKDEETDMQFYGRVRKEHPPPLLPKYKADFLFITNKRFLLVNGQDQLVYELLLDGSYMRTLLDDIAEGNEEAFRRMEEARSQAGTITKLFGSKTNDPASYGAIFGYPILTHAEGKKRALGGLEIELKIKILNLAKRLKSVSGVRKMAYGFYGTKSTATFRVRGYGLKFLESQKTGEVVRLLQSKIEELRPIAEQYE